MIELVLVVQSQNCEHPSGGWRVPCCLGLAWEPRRPLMKSGVPASISGRLGRLAARGLLGLFKAYWEDLAPLPWALMDKINKDCMHVLVRLTPLWLIFPARILRPHKLDRTLKSYPNCGSPYRPYIPLTYG